jgi:hypothetical protein
MFITSCDAGQLPNHQLLLQEGPAELQSMTATGWKIGNCQLSFAPYAQKQIQATGDTCVQLHTWFLSSSVGVVVICLVVAVLFLKQQRIGHSVVTF